MEYREKREKREEEEEEEEEEEVPLQDNTMEADNCLYIESQR